MSDVASLELSRELHELSGWEDTRYYYHSLISHDMKRWSEYKLQDYRPDNDFGMRIVPAYTLGYLLRKLPNFTEVQNIGFDGENEWRVMRHDVRRNPFCIARTPEDAAAKLCIELFKQGILQKESESK